MRFGKGGMWGTAVYFAVNASYSNAYAYKENNHKILFLGEVLVGDHIDLPSQ
jgi:hypothetical protein